MDRFIFNDKTDAVLIRFYRTYEKTLDTGDFVSPKTNTFVYKFIDKEFKRALRRVSRETRLKLKRYRAEAERNGFTLDEFLEILEAEERQRAAEEAAAAEQEEENPVDTAAEAEEPDDGQAQETAEEGETPSEAEEQEQTG